MVVETVIGLGGRGVLRVEAGIGCFAVDGARTGTEAVTRGVVGGG